MQNNQNKTSNNTMHKKGLLYLRMKYPKFRFFVYFINFKIQFLSYFTKMPRRSLANRL